MSILETSDPNVEYKNKTKRAVIGAMVAAFETMKAEHTAMVKSKKSCSECLYSEVCELFNQDAAPEDAVNKLKDIEKNLPSVCS